MFAGGGVSSPTRGSRGREPPKIQFGPRFRPGALVATLWAGWLPRDLRPTKSRSGPGARGGSGPRALFTSFMGKAMHGYDGGRQSRPSGHTPSHQEYRLTGPGHGRDPGCTRIAGKPGPQKNHQRKHQVPEAHKPRSRIYANLALDKFRLHGIVMLSGFFSGEFSKAKIKNPARSSNQTGNKDGTEQDSLEHGRLIYETGGEHDLATKRASRDLDRIARWLRVVASATGLKRDRS